MHKMQNVMMLLFLKVSYFLSFFFYFFCCSLIMSYIQCILINITHGKTLYTFTWQQRKSGLSTFSHFSTKLSIRRIWKCRDLTLQKRWTAGKKICFSEYLKGAMAWWVDDKHLKNNQLWSWKETDKQENMQTRVEKNRKNMKLKLGNPELSVGCSLQRLCEKKHKSKQWKKLKHVNKDSKY